MLIRIAIIAVMWRPEEVYKNMGKKKYIRTVMLLAMGVLVLIGLSFIAKDNKDTIYINTNDKSPFELMGGGGERIYLKFGAIYGRRDDPNKEYNVVDGVFHVTNEWYKQLVFFDTPEEAETAGYKPSENFAKDYDCVKQGKDFFSC